MNSQPEIFYKQTEVKYISSVILGLSIVYLAQR